MPLIEELGLKTKIHNTASQENYELLLSAEKHFGGKSSGILAVLLSDGLISEDELMNGVLAVRLKNTGGDMPFFDLSILKPDQTSHAAVPSGKAMEAAFFTKAGCRSCSRAVRDLEHMARQYPGFVWRTCSIESPDELLYYRFLAIRNGIPESSVSLTPGLVLCGDYLIGEDWSVAALETLLKKHQDRGCRDQHEEFEKSDKSALIADLRGRFRSLSMLPVFAAGLIDGINPCAFGALVLFVSSLLAVGSRGKKIMAVGLSFVAAVFLTYFAVGFGAFRLIGGLQSSAAFTAAAEVIYRTMAVILFVLAAFSLSDFFRALKGDAAGMALQLSDSAKERIRQAIRKISRTEGLSFGAFAAGIVVSLSELACTGQVYLPMIMYVISTEGMRGRAVGLLLLYNIAFILPLLFVFGLVYHGADSISLARLSKRNILIGKLLLAFCFATLGVLLWLH